MSSESEGLSIIVSVLLASCVTTDILNNPSSEYLSEKEIVVTALLNTQDGYKYQICSSSWKCNHMLFLEGVKKKKQ